MANCSAVSPFMICPDVPDGPEQQGESGMAPPLTGSTSVTCWAQVVECCQSDMILRITDITRSFRSVGVKPAKSTELSDSNNYLVKPATPVKFALA